MKKGFTLAEVLITLLIIGVVAALTIPSVISNAQQQEFKTGLKKAVSVLNEAIQMNISQDGETPYETVDILSYLARHMSLALSNSGQYKRANNNHGMFSNRYIYTLDGMRFESVSHDGLGEGHLKLHESGTALLPRKSPKNVNLTSLTVNEHCGSYGLAKNPNNTVTPPCMILVDVNGDKKPNPSAITYELYGNGEIKESIYDDYSYPSITDKRLTDVFNILITEDRAIPFGVVAQRAMYSK